MRNGISVTIANASIEDTWLNQGRAFRHRQEQRVQNLLGEIATSKQTCGEMASERDAIDQQCIALSTPDSVMSGTVMLICTSVEETRQLRAVAALLQSAVSALPGPPTSDVNRSSVPEANHENAFTTLGTGTLDHVTFRLGFACG